MGNFKQNIQGVISASGEPKEQPLHRPPVSGTREWIDISVDLKLSLYRKMYLIRRFEEALLKLFAQGRLTGTTHTYIGQEANAAGIFPHIKKTDVIFSNHRCHGHYLAFKGDVHRLLAEIMGKESGLCGGKGGSQHVCDENFYSNGILGGIVPCAAGAALAEKIRGTENICVVFIGDGALGEGVVYETFNIASLWELPLLVVLENNEYSQSTSIRLNLAGEISKRFEAFNIKTSEIATTNVLTVYEAVCESVNYVRETGKPAAFIINTYRLHHHSCNDDNRPVEEVEERRQFDPLLVFKPELSEGARRQVENEVDKLLLEHLEKLGVYVS